MNREVSVAIVIHDWIFKKCHIEGSSFLENLLTELINLLLQIRDKLSIKSVSEEVKLRLVDEISRDYCLRPEVLALEYASELQKQVCTASVRSNVNCVADEHLLQIQTCCICWKKWKKFDTNISSNG